MLIIFGDIINKNICLKLLLIVSMTTGKCAQHALRKDKKSRLKRGVAYVYDTMNVLYSMCSIAAIADLLQQEPAVPTRELVDLFLCLCILE